MIYYIGMFGFYYMSVALVHYLYLVYMKGMNKDDATLFIERTYYGQL